MDKIYIGLWKQTSKNGKKAYYVGYFMGLRIALLDNSEGKKKNPKAPDLKLIVSTTQSNFNKKVEENVDFEPVDIEELEEENSFKVEGAES